MPRNGGDTISWFEQGTSSARCIITQFHRPAELKLKRMYTRHAAPVCSPDIREFYFFGKGGASCGAQSKSQSIPKTMDTLQLRAPGPVGDFPRDFWAIVFGATERRWPFSALFVGNNAPGDTIDTFYHKRGERNGHGKQYQCNHKETKTGHPQGSWALPAVPFPVGR